MSRPRITLNKAILVSVLLVVLTTGTIIKGVIPAFTRIQTDFPNYYTAGMIARTGLGIERIYDDAWFQDQIFAHGMVQQGKFSPFPPPTALLFAPLSLLEPLAALRVVTLINLLLLLLSIWLISRLFEFSIPVSAAFALLSGVGLINCLQFGQLYIALSCSILLSYFWIRNNRQIPAGVSAGLLAPIKYFSFLLLPAFVVRRQWRALVAGTLTVAFIFCCSVAFLGWDVHEQWVLSVLGAHLQSNLSLQNPFSSTFQSFDSLFRRLYLYDARWNPNPFVDAPWLYVSFKIICITSIVTAAAGIVALLGRAKEPAAGLTLSILCLGGLAIAPATATYHFLLLWLPVGILLQFFRLRGKKGFFWSTGLLYSAIGFIPYSFFRGFDTGGLVTPLAYPRLFLLLLLFGLAITAAVLELGANAASQSRVE